MHTPAAVPTLEAPLLRVPFDALKRAAKEHKAILDEAGEAASEALDGGGASGSQGGEGQAVALDALACRLQGLKRKLGAVVRLEGEEAQRCRARLDHLGALSAPAPSVVGWNTQRLARLLVDHLNRSGHLQTAGHLAASSSITDLVDSHIFNDARKVTDALRQHDCSVALAWCAEHRPRLRKAKSKLEFELRVQEFIELARRRAKMEAIAYAREHLSPWASQYMQEFQRAVAALAFAPSTQCEAFRALYDPSRWQALEASFLRELYRLSSLPPQSQLLVHLQAGLSALKMPGIKAESGSREDPLHLPAFRALARHLPFSKHVHSKLLCSVTRTILTDANPPIVLPNGYVYSQRAIEMLTAQSGGRVVCPKTGQSFGPEELRRAFIV